MGINNIPKFPLNLKIQARALDGVGAHFRVGHGYMVRMLGVGFQGFGGL